VQAVASVEEEEERDEDDGSASTASAALEIGGMSVWREQIGDPTAEKGKFRRVLQRTLCRMKGQKLLNRP
jgi:hypothetical protein